jgi:hypothetical protein
MLTYTHQDVVEAFDKAKNTNAAVKKFLKNEVSGDAKSEKFAKNFKTVLASPNAESKSLFVKNHLDDYEPHFLVLARYAYSEPMMKITEEVITKYADAFNETYVLDEGKVTVKDDAKFKTIIGEVSALIDEGLKRNQVPPSSFMKKVMFFNIFDKDVLPAVLPIVET